MEFAKTPLPSSISVRSVMTAYHLPPRNRVKGGESHWFLELVLASNDRMVILIDGKETVLEDGQLLIYAPNAYHTGNIPTNATLDIITFDAEADMLEELYNTPITPTFSQRQLLLEIVKDGCSMFVRVAPESGYQGMQLREGTDRHSLQSLKNRLELLLLDIYRTYIAAKNGGYNNRAEKLRAEYRSVCDYINSNLTDTLTLDRIAHDNSMSVSKLKSLFRMHYGDGAIAYIIDRKIELAEQLLQNNDYDVTETALRLGFSSVHYFSRLFKKKVGVSPTEWIKSNKI